MSQYDHLDKDALIRLLQRRDAQRQLGLVWEREEIDPDAALNEDYVALDLDPALSHGDAPWRNLIMYLRKLGERLQSSGTFDVARMRHA